MREIKIGEKRFNVHYGQNALCALEDALDEGIDSIVGRFVHGKGLGLRYFRALVWAGLLKENRGMTLEGLGELCDAADVRFSDLVPECLNELVASYGRLIPDESGKEAGSKN